MSTGNTRAHVRSPIVVNLRCICKPARRTEASEIHRFQRRTASPKPVSLNGARQLAAIKESHRKQRVGPTSFDRRGIGQRSWTSMNQPARRSASSGDQIAARGRTARVRAGQEHGGPAMASESLGFLPTGSRRCVRTYISDDQLNRRRKSSLERPAPARPRPGRRDAERSQLHLTLIRNNDREAVTRDPAKWPV